MLAPNKEYQESQTAPDDNPTPLVKSVKEDGCDTFFDHGHKLLQPEMAEGDCVVWYTARLI